jgi:hypothetical protein
MLVSNPCVRLLVEAGGAVLDFITVGIAELRFGFQGVGAAAEVELRPVDAVVYPFERMVELMPPDIEISVGQGEQRDGQDIPAFGDDDVERDRSARIGVLSATGFLHWRRCRCSSVAAGCVPGQGRDRLPDESPTANSSSRRMVAERVFLLPLCECAQCSANCTAWYRFAPATPANKKP